MSINLRHERLKEEFQRVEKLAKESNILKVAGIGEPPEKYIISFNGKGYMLQANDIVITTEHKAVIYLGVNFPILAPDIEWHTDIFHPNFRIPDVCIQGNPWSTLTHLDMIIETLWKMLTYQLFNTENYFNKAAADWAKKNKDKFPCDTRNLREKRG